MQKGEDCSRRALLKGFALAAAAGALDMRLLGAPLHGDLGDGTYLNPILGGDHPDAGAIRVGDDYYLTHSSFQYAPGLPVWHSRDLVSWELVCNGLKRFYGDVWAPYLCRHKELYYIYFPCQGDLKVISSPSPSGPWSEPVSLKIQGIDPAHIASPSGQRFLHFSGGRMAQLADDGLSTKGPVHKVFEAWPIPKEWRTECVCLEAPKLTYKDGYYYLIVAEGGTAGPATSHLAVAARSRNIDGPWEYSPYNPIVHTRSREEKWWSQGHARLVDAADGSWWITFHAYQNGFLTLGRQTLLLPVEWTKDGWFRVPEGVTPDKPIRKPRGQRLAGPSFSDDFKRAELSPQWQFWRNFDAGKFETGKGQLVFNVAGAPLAGGAILSCAVPDVGYEVEVDLEIEGQCDAGLLLFYNTERVSGVYLNPEGVGIRRALPGSPQQALKVPARRATLRLINDRQEVEAHYKLPDKPWERVERIWEISGFHHNMLGGFLSVRPALYACGTGRATFRNFRYRVL